MTYPYLSLGDHTFDYLGSVFNDERLFFLFEGTNQGGITADTIQIHFSKKHRTQILLNELAEFDTDYDILTRVPSGELVGALSLAVTLCGSNPEGIAHG